MGSLTAALFLDPYKQCKGLNTGRRKLALHAFSGIHVGIDNLNVLREELGCWTKATRESLFPLLEMEIFLLLFVPLMKYRGLDAVIVSEAKGHADVLMVADGSVRQDDLVGNDGADTGADLGRLRQNDGVISARRALFQARRQCYPIVVDLHRFMVAVSRIEANHDGYGGTALECYGLGQRQHSNATLFFHQGHYGETAIGVACPVLTSHRRMSLSAPLHWPQGAADSNHV